MPGDLAVGLGQRVRELRISKGIKQIVLARKAGISTSYLSELEASVSVCPSARVLQRIANALDTSISYLLDASCENEHSAWEETPPSLVRAKMKYDLSDFDVDLLSRIEYHGKRPQTEEDWFFLLSAILRSVG